MAKPGSNASRRIVNGGVDLSMKALTDEQARDAQEAIELARGARCSGCGRRITIGFAFTSIDPRDAQRPVMQLAACTREDCGFAQEARAGATYMEMVEFAWLDGNGADAPPALVVQRRNERAAAAGEGAPASSE